MHSYYSQHGTIIRGLQDRWPQTNSFFQKWHYFVGYKAGTRMNELMDEWLVIHSDDRIMENGGKQAIYSLTEAWQDYKIPKPNLIERIKKLFNF